MHVRSAVYQAAILLALAAALAACSGARNNAASAPERAATTAGATDAAVAPSTPAPAASSSTQAGSVGRTVAAGDLNLTVVAVRTVDPKQLNGFSSSDFVVDVEVVNSRGASIAFSPVLDFKLVDTTGASYDADIFCVDCPGYLRSTRLSKGERAAATIYFSVNGATAKQLEYQRFATEPKVVVPLT